MAVNISQFFGSGLINLGSGGIDDLMQGKVTSIINLVINISGLVAVIMIVISGYIMITSSGNSGKIATAQKTLTAAIIGLVIIFLGKLIITFVLSFVGE